VLELNAFVIVLYVYMPSRACLQHVQQPCVLCTLSCCLLQYCLSFVIEHYGMAHLSYQDLSHHTEANAIAFLLSLIATVSQLSVPCSGPGSVVLDE